MQLSDKEREQLLWYKTNADENDVQYKEIIKEKLLDNNKIIWLLDNKILQEADASNDEYFGENILPMFLIAPTQTDVQNYVCFETSFEDLSRSNQIIKIQQIIFYILCHQSNIVVDGIDVARHDLIAAEIINDFHGCNDFGNQLVLTSSKPSVTDNYYATRTLIFEQQTTNSMNKFNKAVRNLR